MAQCPKCGCRLRIYHVSQYCPKCKTNLRFYNFEENFLREAKIAELSQASMFAGMRKLKAAFIGSKLAVARLAVMLLPIIGLLLSAGGFTLVLPFRQVTYDLSGLGLFGILSGSDLGYIMQMCSANIVGGEFAAVRNALLLYLLPAICAVGVFLATLLCFVSLKKMPKVITAFCGAGVISSIGVAIGIGIIAGDAQGTLIIYHGGIGLYVCAALFAAAFAVNFLIVKKGIPVVYDEGVEERMEIWKKVKAGEINIDDLPQPVVETEETRAIDLEIQKQEQAMLSQYGEGAAQ